MHLRTLRPLDCGAVDCAAAETTVYFEVLVLSGRNVIFQFVGDAQ